MVLTNDCQIAGRLKRLALHGMSDDAWKRFSDDGYRHYQVVEVGFKYNMMDLQAAIGMHQVKRIDAYWERRRRIWEQYNSGLAGLPVKRPAELEPDCRHALHLYTILIDSADARLSRDQTIVELHKRKIGVGVHYRAIPTHPFYQQRYGWNPRHYPNSTTIGDSTISLPLSAKLTQQDVSDVIQALSDILG